MVHSSTNLAHCWHLEHLLEEWKLREEEDGGGGGGGGQLTRRQRFREQGGPSKESLQRSHIVSILRQIPALQFARSCVSEEALPEGQLPGDVLWPLSAVSELRADEIFRADWNAIPASADPSRGFGYKKPSPAKRRRRQGHDDDGDDDDEGEEDGGLARGARKRSQVESIATALKSLKLPAGSVVVDFGSGSGALSLPLACVFKELTFVCVDYKPESLRLLDVRAQAAKLINITTWQGRIEDYTEPFDACVALHACGHATDLALLQALRWRAGYVASPCCVGKLQFAVGAPSDVDVYTPESLRTARATKDGYVFPNLISKETHHQLSLDRNENVEMCLAYPRSRWLRSVITRDEFLLLARTADWSSYEYESWTSRLHSLCKIMVELDRNLASQERGYRTSLLSLADQKAGAVGVSHILVGEPSLSSILQV